MLLIFMWNWSSDWSETIICYSVDKEVADGIAEDFEDKYTNIVDSLDEQTGLYTCWYVII